MLYLCHHLALFDFSSIHTCISFIHHLISSGHDNALFLLLFVTYACFHIHHMHYCMHCLYRSDVYIRSYSSIHRAALNSSTLLSRDRVLLATPNPMLLDFTEVFKQTGQLAVFSPGTTYLLTAVQDQLIVRRTGSFQIARTWHVDTSPSTTTSIVSPPTRSSNTRTLRSSTRDQAETESPDGWITYVGWSCDSEYVLACCAKRGVVNVYKMVDEQWNARIEAGAEGLARAEWAPDGRSIVCFSEWGVSGFYCSWRLGEVLILGGGLVAGDRVVFVGWDGDVYSVSKTYRSRLVGTLICVWLCDLTLLGYTFRKDGRYFVLAERHKSRDTIGVYDARDGYKVARVSPPLCSLPHRTNMQFSTFNLQRNH